MVQTVDVDDTGLPMGDWCELIWLWKTLSLFADYVWLANDMDGIFFTGADQVDVDAFTIGVNYLF